MSVEHAPPLAGFEKALGSIFRVHAGEPVDVTLVEVAPTARHPEWECFSLLFSGGEATFSQGMYTVDHAELGTFPLFLVPVLTDRTGPHYEAIFNRPQP